MADPNPGVRRRLPGVVLVCIGAICGIGLGVMMRAGHDAVDAGISRTYRCDQLARNADATQSAEMLLEVLLAGRPVDDLAGAVAAAGLQSVRIDKGEEAIISVGQGPATASLAFRVVDGKVTDLAQLPGDRPCPPAVPR